MQQGVLASVACDRCLAETRPGEQHCPECGAPTGESSLARPAWLTSTIARGSVPASPATRAVSLAISVLVWLVVIVAAVAAATVLGGSVTVRVLSAAVAAIVAGWAIATPALRRGRTIGNIVTRTRSVGILSGAPIGWGGLARVFSGRVERPTRDDRARHPDAIGPVGRLTGSITVSLAKGRDPRRLALQPLGSLGAPSLLPPVGARSHSRSLAGALPSVTLEFDGGTIFPLSGAAVVGRNPPPTEGAAVIAVPDLSRLLSKTHARIEWTGTTVVVTDLASTNGTALEAEDGTLTELAPYVPTPVPLGVSIALADRSVTIHYREGTPT